MSVRYKSCNSTQGLLPSAENTATVNGKEEHETHSSAFSSFQRVQSEQILWQKKLPKRSKKSNTDLVICREGKSRGEENWQALLLNTLCYPTDPRLTYRDWILHRKSIILTALQLCILMISERSKCLALDASGIIMNKFLFSYV